jgi:hypothetical protein
VIWKVTHLTNGCVALDKSSKEPSGIPVNQIRAFSVASGDVSLGMWAWVAMGAGAVLLVLIGISVVDVVRTVKTKG